MVIAGNHPESLCRASRTRRGGMKSSVKHTRPAEVWQQSNENHNEFESVHRQAAIAFRYYRGFFVPPLRQAGYLVAPTAEARIKSVGSPNCLRAPDRRLRGSLSSLAHSYGPLDD